VIGMICFMLAVILFLRIPFGNMPPAIAICIFVLALLEGDGAWALLGCCAAAAAIAVVWTVRFGLLQSAAFFVAKSFG